MKKIALGCCLAIGFSAQAQLHNMTLGCGPVFSGFPFTVQFKGETASLTFKDETFELRFDRTWQTVQGEKWNDYRNDELVLSSSWPDEPYAAISLKNRKNSMAACDVHEVK